MRLNLALVLTFILAPATTFAAGDEVAPASPLVVSHTVERWRFLELEVKRNPARLLIVVKGRASGAWVDGTETVLDVRPNNTRIIGWGSTHGGIPPVCAATFGDAVSVTPTGLLLSRSVLETCGFGAGE